MRGSARNRIGHIWVATAAVIRAKIKSTEAAIFRDSKNSFFSCRAKGDRGWGLPGTKGDVGVTIIKDTPENI